MMRRAVAAALVLALAGTASAAVPPEAGREIEALIRVLGDSGCRFQRNGRWHDAADARAHLQRKYAWLRERDLVASAEQFIERAGTRSSLTGRAYAVQCPGQPAEPSSRWLSRRLEGVRATAHSP